MRRGVDLFSRSHGRISDFSSICARGLALFRGGLGAFRTLPLFAPKFCPFPAEFPGVSRTFPLFLTKCLHFFRVTWAYFSLFLDFSPNAISFSGRLGRISCFSSILAQTRMDEEPGRRVSLIPAPSPPRKPSAEEPGRRVSPIPALSIPWRESHRQSWFHT